MFIFPLISLFPNLRKLGKAEYSCPKCWPEKFSLPTSSLVEGFILALLPVSIFLNVFLLVCFLNEPSLQGPETLAWIKMCLWPLAIQKLTKEPIKTMKWRNWWHHQMCHQLHHSVFLLALFRPRFRYIFSHLETSTSPRCNPKDFCPL